MKQLETLATLGTSRRAPVTVVEMVLQLEPGESGRLAAIVDQLQDDLHSRLASLGLEPDPERWAANFDRPEGMARLAGFTCQTALALQRKAGYKVQFEDFLEDKDPLNNQARFRFIFEHDDPSTGRLAGDLAMRILSESCPDLKWTAQFHDATQPLESSIEAMLESARLLVAPPDVLDLVAAARDRGIPAIRLERDPYELVQADFRVAPNGMVMLGQSCHQVLLDGLFCIERPGPGFSLMKDRRLVWRLLAELGVPKPFRDIDLLTCTTISRARRVARRIGYPLRVWPLQRDSAAAEGWHVSDEAGLGELFARPNLRDRTFMLEPEPKGQRLDLIFANGRLRHAMLEGKAIEVDPHIEHVAGRIARAVNAGLLLLRYSVGEAEGDGPSPYLVTHLDPAPPLRQLLAGDNKRRREILGCFLDWIFPPGTPCRIPVIAVTGTNGKTTTSIMISKIAQAAGRHVGMAQTVGVYFDGQLQELGDRSGFMGHCRVFENRSVDMAVLETARGGLVRKGFTFDRCDVAVCTNVTADHLGQHGIETVEQMAVIKRSVLERADKAVVLNADDPHCLAMLDSVIAEKICLVSMSDDQEALIARAGKNFNCSCVLERVSNEDWLVIHDQGRRLAVIPVKHIPATFDGTAGFNVSNAMHAVAATYLVSIDIELIRSAMSEFKTDYETTPGRMNVFDDLSFRVIMDFAHNPDGFLKLSEFVDHQDVAGKKIVALSGGRKRNDETLKKMARAMAGHYDFYFCKDYKPQSDFKRTDVTQVLRDGLIEAGVAENQTAIKTYGKDAIFEIFDTCRPGDLLVMTIGNLEQHELPVYIREYANRMPQNMAKSP